MSVVPIVCYTCGRPVGHLYEEYLNLVDKYRKEQSENENEKSNENKQSPQFKALRDLKIGTICCRTIIMTHIDMYKET